MSPQQMLGHPRKGRFCILQNEFNSQEKKKKKIEGEKNRFFTPVRGLLTVYFIRKIMQGSQRL